MIEVIDVTKRYGNTVAVNHLSLTVKPGIITGFLGPNGAGKTTTMRMIVGLDSPRSGAVKVDGRDYRDIAAPMKKIGVLLGCEGGERRSQRPSASRVDRPGGRDLRRARG